MLHPCFLCEQLTVTQPEADAQWNEGYLRLLCCACQPKGETTMAQKQLLAQLDTHTALYRDPKSGIAWVENGHTGCGHSCHPNIDQSGSIIGMKRRGAWHKHAKCSRSHGFIYNISEYIASDPLDELAASYCRCGGSHPAHIEQDQKQRLETAIASLK